MSHSLRGRLLWWLLLPLAVFVAIAGAMSYDTARKTADLVQDGALVASARVIAEDVDWEGGALVANVPPAALELFASPAQDHVYYKVRTGGGRLLAGNPDLDGPAAPAASGAQPVLFDTALGGLAIRAVAYTRELYNAGNTETVTVVVGKTQTSRQMMIAAIWHPQLWRLALMLALAMALVYLGLTFELRPLMKLKEDVADRGPMELEPIRTERLHFELRPIVDAINQCIARLNLHAATQRRFIADAAHQLRTPIAVIDTQIQCARQRENGDAALAALLASMQRSSRRMADVTDKLLCGDLVYLFATREFQCGGAPLALRRREHAILETLMLQQGKTVSKARLMDSVYGLDDEPSADAIDIYIHRLRKHLSGSLAQIITLRGLGYILRTQDAAE